MPDPITTLGLAKTTSDIIKDALDFARKAKNSELAEKLIDLYQNFIQLSETNQQLRSEIQQLKGEVAELKKRPEIAARLRHEISTGSYFLKEEDGEDGGPFCTVCWDVDGRLVRQSMVGLQTICQYYCSSQAIASLPSGYSSASSGSPNGKAIVNASFSTLRQAVTLRQSEMHFALRYNLNSDGNS